MLLIETTLSYQRWFNNNQAIILRFRANIAEYEWYCCMLNDIKKAVQISCQRILTRIATPEEVSIEMAAALVIFTYKTTQLLFVKQTISNSR